jgi:uncharacterized protein (TIGR02145 family)
MRFLTYLFILFAQTSFSQTIENVDFHTEGKSIVVTYDFFNSKADTMVNLELQFKDQQGISIIPKTLSGDIKNVKPGQAKRIVWDVLADRITLSGKYKAEVSIQRMAPWVKIGSQVWTTENLNVSTFRNGDPIPEAKTKEEWVRAGENKQPAWCYYDNDPKNGAKYGKLYNWYAVNDSRGLAPVGYHIPSDDEWTKLHNFLGGDLVAGSKIKSTSGWENNGNGTNSSGFSGLPGGLRDYYGYYYNIGNLGYWWSASEFSTNEAYSRYLNEMYDYLNRSKYVYKEKGFSVRCLRD